ncbi:MAG: hypothetical protein U0559_01720 [Anaerolineae bacterium]
MLKRVAIAIGLSSCSRRSYYRDPKTPQSDCELSVLPADNIWNVPVDQLSVDTNSATYVNAMGAASKPMRFRSGTWEGFSIGIPYTTVPGNQPKFTVDFW